MKALSIKNLTKTYANGTQALKGIDFSVDAGDFYALLGPNGAGKTTAIGIITSLVNKTAGEVEIFGHNIDTELEAAKTCIGLVPQEVNMNLWEKVHNVVLNQAGYYGLERKLAHERTEKYLRALRLWEQLDDRRLKLKSEAALVVDHFGNTLYAQKDDTPKPIASLTKLMTAMVVLDAGLPLQEKIEITKVTMTEKDRKVTIDDNALFRSLCVDELEIIPRLLNGCGVGLGRIDIVHAADQADADLCRDLCHIERKAGRQRLNDDRSVRHQITHFGSAGQIQVPA